MHSRDLIEQYKGYVQNWRRYFHKHPELSNEEFETTKTLAKELESMGVEVHVDTERAKVESPYHSTIVHGYLTLSLLPHMWNQIIEVNNLKMMINYGMDKMKFGQAVLAGQSIRMVASLHSLQNLRGVAKAEIKFTIEIKDQPKKALEGIAIFLYYFN